MPILSTWLPPIVDAGLRQVIDDKESFDVPDFVQAIRLKSLDVRADTRGHNPSSPPLLPFSPLPCSKTLPHHSSSPPLPLPPSPQRRNAPHCTAPHRPPRCSWARAPRGSCACRSRAPAGTGRCPRGTRRWTWRWSSPPVRTRYGRYGHDTDEIREEIREEIWEEIRMKYGRDTG